MKRVFNAMVVAVLVVLGALPVWAEDYAMPYVSMGYDIEDDTSGTFLTYEPQLAFPGYTLDDVLEHDFFGRLAGTNYSTYKAGYEGGLQIGRYVESWTNEQGKLEKVLFTVNGRKTSTYTKVVTVLLTNGVDGVYAFVPENGACNGKVAEDTKFAEFNEDGTVKYLQDSGKPFATADDMAGYGCRGLTMTRYIPSDKPVLAFKGATVDEIKVYNFSGYTCGRNIISTVAQGYNVKVMEESENVATKLRVEMQVQDGKYVKCLVVEFTDGEGGVYARVVKALYVTSTDLGRKFVKDDGTYDGTAQNIARDFSMGNYGVFALKAVNLVDAIATAHWTDMGGDGDAMNPQNWACTNSAGKVVADGIPTNAEATVFLDAPLGRDFDWTGLGAFAFADGTVVDLNGHDFAVGGFANRTTGVTITNANDGVTGDFIVNVVEGETAENTSVAILGDVRLVKEGAGTFITHKAQSYTGGNVVNTGTLKLPNETSGRFYLGADGNTITVGPNGTFSINGCYDLNVYSITLAGGTLRNEGTHQTDYKKGSLGNVTLTADSQLELSKHILFYRGKGATLNLGGHTLSVERTDTTDKILCSFNSPCTITNGTLYIDAGIRLNTRQSGVDLSGANVVINGSWIHNNATFRVADLESNMTSGEGAGVVEVAGVFKTNGNFDNTRLVNGAMLDLTDKADVFSTASAMGDYALTFADGATITVDVSGRALTNGEQVVVWDAIPAGVTFQWDEATAAEGADMRITSDGIFCVQAVATAHWTGAAGDGDAMNPGNWACTNAAGKAVVDAIPTSGTYLFLAQPMTTNLDWTALGTVRFGEGLIDLNGWRLAVESVVETPAEIETLVTNAVEGAGDIMITSGTTKLFTNLVFRAGVTVTVGGGATLDENGVFDMPLGVRLEDGATLTNTGEARGYNKAQFMGGLQLADGATAYIDTAKEFAFTGTGYATMPVDLGSGGTLVKKGKGKISFQNASIVGTGTIRLEEGEINLGNKGLAMADTVTLEILKNTDTFVWIQGACEIPTITGDGLIDVKSANLTVTKSFSGRLQTVITALLSFADGMTLDLTGVDGAWTQHAKMAYAADAKITVDLTGRELVEGDKVISWSRDPATGNLKSKGAEVYFVRRSDGLYAGKTPMIFVR